MSKILEVDTGMVKVGDRYATLIANALGSCIGVVAFDPAHYVGGMAHIMLPGVAPPNRILNVNHYTHNALHELLHLMNRMGSEINRLHWCIAGGANVLQHKDDSICQSNISSIKRFMLDSGFTVSAECLGGTLRRRLRFEIVKGCVYCTVGDSCETLLCDFLRYVAIGKETCPAPEYLNTLTREKSNVFSL
jgi:chemotaxis protein CheD